MSESFGPFGQHLSPNILDPYFITEWPFVIAGDPSCQASPSSDGSQQLPFETPECLSTVSTAFYLGADLPFDQDIAILSKDNVYFYVNSHHILAASVNGFNGLLCEDRRSSSPSSLCSYLDSPFENQNEQNDILVVTCSELSYVLNILLHVIFDMSCAAYAPPFEHISEAIKKMRLYGLQPSEYLVTSSPLFLILLSQAPLHPIEVFAIASQYSVEDLAVTVSSHLLSFPLHKVNDDLAVQIGPAYLRRLFWMHLGRLETLKHLLLRPPYPHPATSSCTFSDQRKLSQAWTFAAMHLVWDSRPDTSNSTIKSAFASIGDGLLCEECKKGLTSRLNQVIIGWSQTKA